MYPKVPKAPKVRMLVYALIRTLLGTIGLECMEAWLKVCYRGGGIAFGVKNVDGLGERLGRRRLQIEEGGEGGLS